MTLFIKKEKKLLFPSKSPKYFVVFQSMTPLSKAVLKERVLTPGVSSHQLVAIGETEG